MIQLTLNILLQAAAVTAGGHDYATAYAETKESGRPLVVLVGAEWCPGCRQMKNATLPELEKKGAALANVAVAYVNTDQQSSLANKLMQGSSIPQLIVYHKTETGWKRQHLTGARAASEIQSLIEHASEASVPKISSRPASTKDGDASGG